MVPFRNTTLGYDKENTSMDLMNWCLSKERILNLISVPYNGSTLLIDMLLYMVQNDKKILYITMEREDRVGIVENLKKFTVCREYAYIRKNSGKFKPSTKLFITDYEMALSLEEKFDLVIYDDISCFPMYSKLEILELLATFYREGARVISWSVELVFQNARVIEFPVRECRIPLVEPRLITTRIDVNKDIPYVVYDYLSWSIKSERKVIIYVPDRDRGENVYRYLWNFRENLHNNIMYYRDESDKKRLTNFIKNKKGIIIMDYYGELDTELRDTDIMVYFADDRVFDYKKLLYFCGKVGKKPELGNGEVIFLAKDSTKDIEIAREVARGFNKLAWDMGLLSF